MDGTSERTNKSLNQALQFFIDHHQSGWVDTLPHVQFNLMSTVNMSTGYSHFHLHLGRLLQLLPPLTPTEIDATRKDFPSEASAALDALLAAKISQANSANVHRSKEPKFAIDDPVYLSTMH